MRDNHVGVLLWLYLVLILMLLVATCHDMTLDFFQGRGGGLM